MKRINSALRRDLRVNLCNRHSGACAYCRRVVGMKGTVDHYLPEALGGTNEQNNLRWACWKCNQLKADMHPAEWALRQPVLRPAIKTKASERIRLLQLCATRGREARRKEKR